MAATAQLSTNQHASKLQQGSLYDYYAKIQDNPYNPQDLNVMLKSHFNLKKEDEEIEPEEESAVPESNVNVDEEKIVVELLSDERILKKSEVSVRLSWLGKTAEGDG